ncbi:MAG TPA: peptide chain release factor N(5)-glutamine methyltransferase [Blastocatellia bacterium]|nr:peptide chain release factor N(5)-glutamine methyltransferase [Blastocatellia bacterium]
MSSSISQAVAEKSSTLQESGVAEPGLTARLLMAYVLGRDRSYLYAHPEERLSVDKLNQFNDLIRRRASGEPLQYITGHQEFYGLDFKVTPAVLIPRPETELIIDQVLKLSQPSDPAQPKGGQALIIDVGTGSGCIAVTLAVKLRWARMIAIDISEAALEIAAFNARQHGVFARIDFVQSNLFEQLRAKPPIPQVDFIVSNPPYVPLRDRATMQREVIEHEPHLALFAEEDGLLFYRRLFAEAGDYLKKDGKLIVEIGINQLPDIENLATQEDWRVQEISYDIQSIPRTLTLIR